tara:strand:+ start:6090 stop:6872 length:783 start_codon:yes stop_codon:yes gene_type:complete
MKPGKLRPVFFDPNNYKLLAERKNGRFDLVDVNQQTKEVAGSDQAHLLRPVEDTERYIDIDSTSGEHFLVYLVNQSLEDYVAPINSTYTVTNIGQGTVEIAPDTLYSSPIVIQSANGAGLAPGASCVLRYRGNNKWHVSGDNGATNAKTYSVNATANSSPPPGNLYNFNGEGLTDEQAPTINLVRNQELVLNINAPGHPVVIQPNQQTGTYSGNQGAYLSQDMSTGGVENGTLKFRSVNTGTWYYNCQHHAGMGAQIIVS